MQVEGAVHAMLEDALIEIEDGHGHRNSFSVALGLQWEVAEHAHGVSAKVCLNFDVLEDAAEELQIRQMS